MGEALLQLAWRYITKTMPPEAEVASGREARAGGGVVKAAVPSEAENADLRAVQKAKSSP